MLYDAALLERPLDEGLDTADINRLLKLCCGPFGEVYTVDIQSNNSAAIGFINADSFEKIDYQLSKLEHFVEEILSDMDKEVEDGVYSFSQNGVRLLIHITR